MNTAFLLARFHELGKVCTDTRKITGGELFFALRGENFNGNRFAAKALEAGAALVVVDDPEWYEKEDERYVLVANSLKALQQLSRAYRREWGFPVLAITGSNGKTTTKELIYAVLSTEKRCFATEGNLNNHIGVPLSLLAVPADSEIAVIEMGANQPGDIKELVELAEPTHGLITNIGQAHLARFGDLEGVRKTKGELFDFLREHQGHIFLNEAEALLIDTASGIQRRTTFGRADSEYTFELKKQQLHGMELLIMSKHWGNALLLQTQLSGRYNAMNVLSAVVVADFFGISKAAIQKGIYSYVATNNRSQIIQQQGKTIWLDAYNANPSSMRAAIDNLFAYRANSCVLILGDMLEMGKKEAEIHAEMGRYINQHSPAMTIGVGRLMKEMVEALQGPGKWYESTEAAFPYIRDLCKDAEIILIKGSRGMALEKLLPKILEEK